MSTSQPERSLGWTLPSAERTGVRPISRNELSLFSERDIARTTCVRVSAFAIPPPTNPDAPVMKICMFAPVAVVVEWLMLGYRDRDKPQQGVVVITLKLLRATA